MKISKFFQQNILFRTNFTKGIEKKRVSRKLVIFLYNLFQKLYCVVFKNLITIFSINLRITFRKKNIRLMKVKF